MFRNYYRCERCQTEWSDDWDCMCDDRCPSCNQATSPFDSEDIEDDEAGLHGPCNLDGTDEATDARDIRVNPQE